MRDNVRSDKNNGHDLINFIVDNVSRNSKDNGEEKSMVEEH